MTKTSRPLAVITGASTGIGYELARCCAENGFNLIVAADEDEIEQAAEHFRDMGCSLNRHFSPTIFHVPSSFGTTRIGTSKSSSQAS